MTELKTMVDEVVKNAGSALERDAAIALRRIEHAAKMMHSADQSGDPRHERVPAAARPRPRTATGRRKAGSAGSAGHVIIIPGSSLSYP